MDPIECLICKETNHIPERSILVMATFAQKFQAKEALAMIQKSHISYVWEKIFMESEKVVFVLSLHGIKDIVNLQALYIESMCQASNALTIDIVTQKIHQDKLLSTLS